VLCGAPAVVAAVDRYARVRVTLGDRPGPLVIESPIQARPCVVADPERGELPGGDAGAVIAALRAARERAGELAGRAAEVAVDARPFLVGTRKLGLGRSAATLVAATAAFLAAAGHGDRAEAFEAALEALALLQDGHGSGADVAASVHGGLLEVVRRSERLVVAARRLPAGLCLVVGWTGESAPTAPLLRRFADAMRGAPAGLGALRAEAERAAAAVAGGDRALLLDAVERSAVLLERLGAEVGIPIVTPALARLIAAARRVGAVAKPSGAGAGDCGIALAGSPAQAAAVVAAWREEGIVPVETTIAEEGVHHEVSRG